MQTWVDERVCEHQLDAVVRHIGRRPCLPEKVDECRVVYASNALKDSTIDVRSDQLDIRFTCESMVDRVHSCDGVERRNRSPALHLDGRGMAPVFRTGHDGDRTGGS
ncbi:hypothetical protein RN2511_012330 [Rhodococcus sp. NKCM2511]|nr:hypothetical protein RN2511_012330 [Rhodococcus sp. NKCM2511]